MAKNSNMIYYKGDTYSGDTETIKKLSDPSNPLFTANVMNGTDPLPEVDQQGIKTTLIPRPEYINAQIGHANDFTAAMLNGDVPLPKSNGKILIPPQKEDLEYYYGNQKLTVQNNRVTIPAAIEPEFLEFYYGDQHLSKTNGIVVIPAAQVPEYLTFYYGNQQLSKTNGEVHIPEPVIPDELEFQMADREDFTEEQLDGEEELPKINGVVQIPKAETGTAQVVNAERNQVLIGDGENWIEASPFYTEITEENWEPVLTTQTVDGETKKILSFYISGKNISINSVLLTINNEDQEILVDAVNNIKTAYEDAQDAGEARIAQYYSSDYYKGKTIEGFDIELLEGSLVNTAYPSYKIYLFNNDEEHLAPLPLFEGTYDDYVRTSYIDVTTNLPIYTKQSSKSSIVINHFSNTLNNDAATVSFGNGAKVGLLFKYLLEDEDILPTKITVNGTGNFSVVADNYSTNSNNGTAVLDLEEIFKNNSLYAERDEASNIYINLKENENTIASLKIKDNTNVTFKDNSLACLGGDSYVVMDGDSEFITHGHVKINITNYEEMNPIEILIHDSPEIIVDGQPNICVRGQASFVYRDHAKFEIDGYSGLYMHGKSYISCGDGTTQNQKPFAANFASGMIEMSEDTDHTSPFIVMKGGGIVFNGKDTGEGNPLILCERNSFVFSGDGTSGVSMSFDTSDIHIGNIDYGIRGNFITPQYAEEGPSYLGQVTLHNNINTELFYIPGITAGHTDEEEDYTTRTIDGQTYKLFYLYNAETNTKLNYLVILSSSINANYYYIPGITPGYTNLSEETTIGANGEKYFAYYSKSNNQKVGTTLLKSTLDSSIFHVNGLTEGYVNGSIGTSVSLTINNKNYKLYYVYLNNGNTLVSNVVTMFDATYDKDTYYIPGITPGYTTIAMDAYISSNRKYFYVYKKQDSQRALLLTPPRFSIRENTHVAFEGLGQTYFQVQSGYRQKLRFILNDGSFVQHGGKSHLEMWDESYITADCDANGHPVFRVGSSNSTSSSTSGTPGFYNQPFVCRRVNNSLRYISGAEEAARENSSASIKAPFVIHFNDTNEKIITGISGGATSTWTLANLNKLLDENEFNNSNNPYFFRAGTLKTENGEKFIYNGTRKICKIEIINSPLSLKIGPLLQTSESYNSYRDLVYLYQGSYEGNIQVNFAAAAEDFTITIMGLSPYAPNLGKTLTYTAGQTSNGTSINTCVDSATRAMTDNFIGMDSCIVASPTSYSSYNGMGTIFGTNSRLGSIESSENPGYIAFGSNYGVKIFGGMASTISIKCGSASITTKDGGTISVENSASLRLSGTAAIQIDNSGTINLSTGGQINISQSGQVAVSELGALEAHSMKIVADYDTEVTTSIDEVSGEEVTVETHNGKVTITSLCDGDIEEGETSASITFTFDELKALKALLSNE